VDDLPISGIKKDEVTEVSIELLNFPGQQGLVDNQLNVLKVERLPNNWSAQTYELYAFNQDLKLLKGKAGATYMDSKYAFGMVYTFGKIWTERAN
jgi:hypothetical protein